MAKRVPLGNPPSPRQIAEHHTVVKEAIDLYYSSKNPDFHQLFAFDTPDEIRASRDVRLQEASAASALTLLAAIMVLKPLIVTASSVLRIVTSCLLLVKRYHTIDLV